MADQMNTGVVQHPLKIGQPSKAEPDHNDASKSLFAPGPKRMPSEGPSSHALPNSEGQKSSQGQSSDGLSDTWFVSPVPSLRRQSMESGGGNDGDDEDSCTSWKHSHDESDDGSNTSEKRIRRRQMEQGTGPVQTDRASENSTDGAQQEEPLPLPYDIASATIPDHLLNTPAFRNAGRFTNRPRSHTTTTSSTQDMLLYDRLVYPTEEIVVAQMAGWTYTRSREPEDEIP